ncbi:ribonuclease III [Altererythrobacter aquiaggeris]|uniref:ribonuclease III n=1 Tax=Aestuarierythrobacter aquiaggeris TaxID=1898396 RepID=UPI00301883CC
MTLAADQGLTPETRVWLAGLGIEPEDDLLYLEALTHGSYGAKRNYERLEFLGDRVLGLSIAEWLFERNPASEGALSQRLNALVSRQTCAVVARQVGLPDHIRMGKQARDDGGAESDNILGDVIESLLGASFIERGFDETRDLIHRIWSDLVLSDTGISKHPKSALQEWAAGNQRKPPEYEIKARSGPDHAAQFTVTVTVKNVGTAEATAASKREAQTAAALAFMEKFA